MLRSVRAVGLGLTFFSALSAFFAQGCSPSGVASAAPNAVTSQAGMMASRSVGASSLSGERDGSEAAPLRMLTMAGEGAAADKVRANLMPVLDAITKDTGLHFEVKYADSYAGTVEGLATRQADVCQMAGPFAYMKARERGAAELLAVGVRAGESTYYSGIFTRKTSGIKTLKDLKNHSMAFGDVNSMSAFNYPCAMMIKAGVDPSKDLSAVYLTSTHANVIAALAAGKVDAGTCSIGSFESAAREGRIVPEDFLLVAKSDALPGTPIVMYPKLPAEIKAKLRKGYANLADNQELLKRVQGDSGKPLDRYDTTITDADYDKVAVYLRPINDDFKAAMLMKAGKVTKKP